MVIGKLHVSEVAEVDYSRDVRRIRLTAEYDGSLPEDKKFSAATPCAQLEMTVDNPTAVEQLKVRESKYVLFLSAEEYAAQFPVPVSETPTPAQHIADEELPEGTKVEGVAEDGSLVPDPTVETAPQEETIQEAVDGKE
jgi:hypothetical protein